VKNAGSFTFLALIVLLVAAVAFFFHEDNVQQDKAQKQEAIAQESQRDSLLNEQVLATMEGCRAFAREHGRLPKTDELDFAEMMIPAGKAGYIPGQGFSNPLRPNHSPAPILEFSPYTSSSNPGQICFQGADNGRDDIVVWVVNAGGSSFTYSYHLPARVQFAKK